MATAVECIDSWVARELAGGGLLVAAERQEVTDRTASHRWYLRFKGEEKDFITVWFTLRQRTLHHETQFMPAPEKNVADTLAYLMRCNANLYGMWFSLGPEDAVYLVGKVPGRPDRRRRAGPDRRLLGHLRRRPLPHGHDPGPSRAVPPPAPTVVRPSVSPCRTRCSSSEAERWARRCWAGSSPRGGWRRSRSPWPSRRRSAAGELEREFPGVRVLDAPSLRPPMARRRRAGRQARRGRRGLPGPRCGRGDPGPLHRRRHPLPPAGDRAGRSAVGGAGHAQHARPGRSGRHRDIGGFPRHGGRPGVGRGRDGRGGDGGPAARAPAWTR